MVPLRGIHDPKEKSITEGNINGRIAARDGIGDDTSDGIQQDVVNTEPPNKVSNVSNIFLMWLRFISMLGFIKLDIELGIDLVQWASRVSSFAQHRAAIHIAEKSIKLI